MNQFGPGLPALDRHFQSPADFFGLQTAMYVVAHNPSGIGIRDQAEVGKPLPSRNVGDVRYPDLLCPGCDHLLWTILEQVGMFMEAVVAIRRLVIRALGRREQACRPQHIKQTVAPQFDTAFCERAFQEVMQFTRTDPGLLHTPGLNKLDYHRVPFIPGLFTAQLFVICLSAGPIMTASRRDAQAFDLALLDDLPKGFFGILIPYAFLITSSMASNKRAFSLACLS